MNVDRAKELLTVLADGINPITGELLAENDCCNQVEIVRALNIVLRQLDNSMEKTVKDESEKVTKLELENAGKPWTKEAEEVLCNMYDAGCSKKEICNYFKRSKGAIAARLVRLGKINERDEFGRN